MHLTSLKFFSQFLSVLLFYNAYPPILDQSDLPSTTLTPWILRLLGENHNIILVGPFTDSWSSNPYLDRPVTFLKIVDFFLEIFLKISMSYIILSKYFIIHPLEGYSFLK